MLVLVSLLGFVIGIVCGFLFSEKKILNMISKEIDFDEEEYIQITAKGLTKMDSLTKSKDKNCEY